MAATREGCNWVCVQEKVNRHARLGIGIQKYILYVDACAKKMMCEDIEEKWGKNKESRSLGFRRTVARDLRLRDSGGFGFIRFGPHNLCAATTFCVDIYHSFHAQSCGRGNLVANI